MSSSSEKLKFRRFAKWIQAIERGVLMGSRKETEDLKEEIKNLLKEEQENQTFFHDVKANQDIVLVGAIGQAGTYLLGKYYAEQLLERLPGRFIKMHQDFKKVMHCYPSEQLFDDLSISAIYTVGEGGLFKSLYQLGKDTGKGYRILGREVPVSQVTIEFCEALDLHPWELLSGGCTLLVTSEGSRVIRRLKEALQVPCVSIGYTTDDKEKLILYAETPARVNRPQPDALLSVIGGLE